MPSDVARATVTEPDSPRVIIRDIQRDNRDKRRVVRRRRINDIAVILENFDKPTLRSLLINKERRVGDIVLVNGKPAVIRKRRVAGKTNEDDMSVDSLLKVMQTSVLGSIKPQKKIRVRFVNKKNSLRGKVRKAETSLATTKKPQLKRRKILRKRLNSVV